MFIGIPKEIKNFEERVGLTPDSVSELVKHGHKVLVEHDAGLGSGFSDEDYVKAGAVIASDAKEVFKEAELIVKVKEPQLNECEMLRKGQILFTYLHLAADPKQTQALLKSGCIAIAYETVTDQDGRLPLLAPMSAVAGRLSVQAGAHCLEKAQGGSGILLGGVYGVLPAKVLVLGAGVVGGYAIKAAVGLEAEVLVLDKSLPRLKELDLFYGNKIETIYSTEANLEKYAPMADLIVGAVLLPGAKAPKLIKREMIKKMRPGSVIVDVAIDQGGCIETSHPTTHAEPTFVEEGVVHYCVANMPGAVPRTSTFALNNATLPFVLNLANKGYIHALKEDADFRNGLNVFRGHITHKAVADALSLDYVDATKVLK